MITIERFRGKTRERLPEWITSIGIFWWGIITLMLPELFNQTYFYPLSLFMSQPLWGVTALLVGGGAIISLLVNGIYRPTAHLRVFFSFCKVMIWTSLLLASATTAGRELGVPTFGMLIALDSMALWWAAGDAKLADNLAAKKKKVNGT